MPKKKRKIVVISLLMIVIIPVSSLFQMFLVGALVSPSAWFIADSFIQRFRTDNNPPLPSVTYGEFPFELEYEFNGVLITVSDIYVCEFAGFRTEMTCIDKIRVWKGYIKSTGEEGIFVYKGKTPETKEKVFVYIELGAPQYYMGDPDCNRWYPNSTDDDPQPFFEVEYRGDYFMKDTAPITEWSEEFQYPSIKKFTIADPIKNTFE